MAAVAPNTYACAICGTGSGTQACHGCGEMRCTDHLLLEARSDTEETTRWQTYMQPGAIVHVTPQGQPFFGPSTPVQHPVTVRVPILRATTADGRLSTFAMPSTPDGAPLRGAALEAAVRAWASPRKTCLWCRETAAQLAALAVLERERQAASERAAETAATERKAAAERTKAEKRRSSEHAELLRRVREEFGPAQPLITELAEVQRSLANREPSTGWWNLWLPAWTHGSLNRRLWKAQRERRGELEERERQLIRQIGCGKPGCSLCFPSDSSAGRRAGR